jgi:hypothetical protein
VTDQHGSQESTPAEVADPTIHAYLTIVSFPEFAVLGADDLRRLRPAHTGYTSQEEWANGNS